MPEQSSNVTVWMLNRDLALVPRLSLPDGYHMRFYREGDVDTWLRIQSGDPISVPTAESFARSMPGDTAYLAERVMFLVDPSGSEIGTITAWHNDRLLDHIIGQIHWVAIIPSARGQGLAKPMLAAACEALRRHGYTQACLETSTGRVPALNLYLQCGFEPYSRDDTERAAWRAVAPQLKRDISSAII